MRSASNWSDLATRLVSALFMAGMALAINHAGLAPFTLLVVVGALIGNWEWNRLTTQSDWKGAFVGPGLALSGAALLAYWQQYAPAIAILVLPLAVLWGVVRRDARASAGMLLFGAIYMGLPMVALIWLRSDPAHGAAAILFLFLVVWAVDTGAYLAGRAIGGPKLAPIVSPNKTWSGFLGGVGAGALVGVAFAHWFPPTPALLLALIGLALGASAQMGDLFESYFKRRFKTKDMSSLIPGHGGLLDRIDGFLFAAIGASLLALLHNQDTAGAGLLLWN